MHNINNEYAGCVNETLKHVVFFLFKCAIVSKFLFKTVQFIIYFITSHVLCIFLTKTSGCSISTSDLQRSDSFGRSILDFKNNKLIARHERQEFEFGKVVG